MGPQITLSKYFSMFFCVHSAFPSQGRTLKGGRGISDVPLFANQLKRNIWQQWINVEDNSKLFHFHLLAFRITSSSQTYLAHRRTYCYGFGSLQTKPTWPRPLGPTFLTMQTMQKLRQLFYNKAFLSIKPFLPGKGIFTFVAMLCSFSFCCAEDMSILTNVLFTDLNT